MTCRTADCAQIFAVPKTARRAKPFVDHILNFSICDGKIWFRNYQVSALLQAARCWR